MTGRGPILAIDTATRQATLAVGGAEGRLLGQRAWPAGHRHTETLLAELERLLADTAVGVRSVAGIVAGVGPGAFTGLRVGLATAKTLAYGLGCPIRAVGTAEALALAAAGDGGQVAVLQPAGPNDRYLSRCLVEGGTVRQLEPSRLLAGREGVPLEPADRLVAVDLEPGPGIPEAAAEGGRAALGGLGQALLRLGARGLAERPDDVAELVAAYVTLPRGVAAAAGGREWSPDLR